ncbi:MAG: endolytic transglycosylase MltG [Bacteroidetes bacterium]|nr:MAG: endolytic transglycosylase MltG [Bacteroidota bacterium]
MTQKKKRKKIKRTPFWIKVIISLFLIVIISGGIAAYRLYHAIYQPNIFLGERRTTHIFIPTGSNFNDVKAILYENGMIINTNTFEWLAEKKNYKNLVKPGRYLIHEDMGNNELINLLRSGNQDPVRLTFNNIRTKEELAGSIARQIEADSVSIIRLFKNTEFLSKYNLTSETAKLLFIPNTYEFFWNTSAEQLFERMNREFNSFWNEERLRKAQNINLSPLEVGTLASIVQSETSRPGEFSKVAGVYINRLNRNMPLQADPTVIFAVGDFSIRRVLNRHLEIDSPYNTYKYAGLPPGPINLPEMRVLDGVLNYQKHEYLFFCARDDFSGYHAFARTYSQHLANARRYQNALNQRRIMR